MTCFQRDVDQLFANGKQVYRGYVDDPRATDHAWMETTAFHFHCNAELGSMLPLKAGDDAKAVTWLDVSSDEERYEHLYASHKEWVDRIWQNMRRKMGESSNKGSDKADGPPLATVRPVSRHSIAVAGNL